MIIKVLKRRLVAFLSVFLLAIIASPVGMAEDQGHWTFLRAEIVKPGQDDLGKLCTFTGDGGRNGSLGGAKFQTRCYSTISRRYTTFSGNLAWSFQTAFDTPAGEFNAGLDTLIPGKFVGFALDAASTSTANGVTGWVTMRTTHPHGGAVSIAGTPYAQPNGKSTGRGYAKIFGKPVLMPDGSLPNLLLAFELTGGNNQRGIKVNYVYKWNQAGALPPPSPPVAVPPVSPTPPIGVVTPVGKPIGCFVDKDQRDLDGAHSYANDASACVAFCASKGFRYAAKQAGTQCFCGNTYGRYGASTACVECRGLSAAHCGGSYANFVWEVSQANPSPSPQIAAPPVSPTPPVGAVTPVGKPIGCFVDKDQRDLGGAHSYADDASACVGFCASKGFRYAAKQAGTHCFCGNTYGRYGASTACVECRGLSAAHCGGSYANFVWEVTKE